MAEFAGKPAALWMNYDLTFLSVLLSSLAGGGEARSAACTALPWRRVPVAALPTWGREALAAINLALLAAKLEDDRQDEPGLARRLAGAWVGSYQKRVEAVLSGPPLELIRALPERQFRAEQQAASLEELSRPTAEVIAGLLEHVGELAGRPERVAELGRLGSALGRYLYYLDAAQDFRQDARKGRFNALQACWGPAWQEARAAALLHRCLEELAAALRRFEDLTPLGGLIDPLLDSLADRLPLHTSWVPSWRRAQAAHCDCPGCDCGGCDGCGHADCCAHGHHGDCCSGCNLFDGCSGSEVDCCCQGCDCCHTASSAPVGTAEPLRCPGCRATLQARKAGRVEVDTCPFCAGIWLDKNELQA